MKTEVQTLKDSEVSETKTVLGECGTCMLGTKPFRGIDMFGLGTQPIRPVYVR